VLALLFTFSDRARRLQADLQSFKEGRFMQAIGPFLKVALALTFVGTATPLFAQDQPAPTEAPSGAAELSIKLSNPISNLISVPFQENIDFGIGPDGDGDGDGVRSVLNIQPVVPISIGKDWNVIVRTIVPVVYSDPSNGTGTDFGLGDITQSFFFSPKSAGPGGIIWGVGPALLYPTATEGKLGGEAFGAGPTIVLLKQSRGLTVGFLGNQIWSYAHDSDRSSVSQAFLQPFVSHTWPSSVSVSLNTESVYNWKTEKWTVPINAAVSRVIRIGKQPISVQAGARYYASTPEGGPNWGLRVMMILLFPKK
jgi:hypothetical protein